MRVDFFGAIKRVIDTSPTLEEYRGRIGEATARIREAQTPAYPQATLDSTYTRLDPSQTVNFGGRLIPLSVSDNYNILLTLRQAVFTFGRLEWGSLAAQMSERAVREEYRAQLEGLMSQAADAYIGVLLAGEEVNIYRKQLESRERSLRDAEALFRSGTVARFDVLRAASEVSNARQELLVAENQVRLAVARLATLMDFPPDTNLELEPLGQADPPGADLQTGRARALLRRPEVVAVQWALEASQARVGFENSQDKPSLGVLATGVQRNATGLGLGQQWSTNVVLSIPFYDGGLAQARTQAAREVVRQLKARLHAVERDVSLDVERAWLDMHTRWERIQVATRNLEQADEAARVARVRYNSGVSTSVELLDAETALTRARQLLASARFLYFASQVAWHKAISGEYPVPTPEPLPSDKPLPPRLRKYDPTRGKVIPPASTRYRAPSVPPAPTAAPAPRVAPTPAPASAPHPTGPVPSPPPQKGSKNS